jgi:hypothetical protein
MTLEAVVTVQREAGSVVRATTIGKKSAEAHEI